MRGRGRPPRGTAAAESELPDLLDLWNQAITSPRGIAIQSQRPNRLLQRLYWARREAAGDDDANPLHNFTLVEKEDEVQIVPKVPR